MYQRHIAKQIKKWMFQENILILYGARQVGKTTLAKKILEEYGSEAKYIDCDLISNSQALSVRESNLLKNFIGDYRVVIIDEAQRVDNIGVNLKILHGYFPDMQIIATGSSSFDLANQINEPLTGRAIEFLLQPLSVGELRQKYDALDLSVRLEEIMRFGLYPAVFEKPEEVAQKKLEIIVSNYLYKDILAFDKIKKSDILLRLLELLALQVGSEVSLNELAQKLQISHLTVDKYLDLLEKTFVIFRLRGFKRNLRSEIGKPFKVYFWDLGVRNTIIRNFNPMRIRNDVGSLFENFCIVEKMKQNLNTGKSVGSYFWRTKDQKEIDYIEEYGGKLHAYEFKWSSKKKPKIPKSFAHSYPQHTFEVVNQNNWLEIIG